MAKLGKLVLPFGNNSKAKRRVDEATAILADAQRQGEIAASQVRAVQARTREIVDLVLLDSTRVDVTTAADDYPRPYYLVDARRAKDKIDEWRKEAEA